MPFLQENSPESFILDSILKHIFTFSPWSTVTPTDFFFGIIYTDIMDYGVVAPLVESFVHIEEVTGSNPVGSTKLRPAKRSEVGLV